MRQINCCEAVAAGRAVAVGLFSLAAATVFGAEAPRPPGVIAFGSCAKESAPQPIWDAVVKKGPGLFLFLGDNIYGDTEDMGVLREKYSLLGAQLGFRKLKAQCPVLATWDDHDYGKNDAGAEYPMKREAEAIMLDFFEVADDDPRRHREGVYGVKVFGGDGGDGGGRLQVILLDTRYFRSPLVKVPEDKKRANWGPYGRNTAADATVLGAAQWRWLEGELRKPADLRLVCTSIQAAADGHGWEKWGNFPEERRRLFKLIRETRANGVVLLSGDRHLGEISRLAADAADGVGYPLYDVTSSGINQAGGGSAEEPNPLRVGGNYRGTNFGLVRVSWGDPDPVVAIEICGAEGEVVLSAQVKLSSLQVPSAASGEGD